MEMRSLWGSIAHVCTLLHVFFFSSRRRHTRCSRDWSSDVCSSDLQQGAVLIERYEYLRHTGDAYADDAALWLAPGADAASVTSEIQARVAGAARSEERRGGEEGRSRWVPDHYKKKEKLNGNMHEDE